MAGIYLVRHGRAGESELTNDGRREAESARDALRDKGLGRSALVLSSSALRAYKTAEVIAEGLGVDTVLSAPSLDRGGNKPEVIGSLDRVLEACLGGFGIEEVTDGLVVVTHMPLISLARFGDRYEVTKNGEVWEYSPGSWTNPEYKPDHPPTQAFERALGL